jgi:hypothetical protein
MRAKSTIGLAAASAGLISLAPPAQADLATADPDGTDDPNISLSLTPATGDPDTLGLSIDLPDDEVLVAVPGVLYVDAHMSHPDPVPLLDSVSLDVAVSGGSFTNVSPVVRLCITCRR